MGGEAHLVAPPQAVAEHRLENATGEKTVRRVWVGKPDQIDTIDSVTKERTFVKAACGRTARAV